jgi:DNA-binding MarR family transcriptional regulator
MSQRSQGASARSEDSEIEGKLPKTWTLFGPDHLPYRLLLLARMIDRQASRKLQAEFNISLAEWRVLAFIGVSGPSTAATIGAQGRIDRAEISRAVAALESKGLATREPHATNRRKLIIKPTSRGAALFDEVRHERQAFFQSMLATIPRENADVVERSLTAMATWLQQVSES